MVGSTPPLRIPLPKGWPRSIRSAVIHAISLARFSLTHTRSWAARIRLKHENDRLRQEVVLLINDIRSSSGSVLPRSDSTRYPSWVIERGQIPGVTSNPKSLIVPKAAPISMP